MKERLTPRRAEALRILRDNVDVPVRRFADLFYAGDRYARLFSAISKGSGGEVIEGRKAWLCAGSFLRKMKKDGLLWSVYVRPFGGRTYYKVYRLTTRGEQALREYDAELKK